MSHAATKWAIDQRGLKPAAKIVLWQLCDRYNPDFGCFPSQDRLAEDCEMSRSALNDHLAALEKAGLIAREQRRDPVTSKVASTRYRLAFEPDFPCPESGHGAVSGNDPEPCPENAESRVRNPDTNLVREPVREPLSAREAGQRESESGFPERGEEAGSAEAKAAEIEARKRWRKVRSDYPHIGLDDIGKAERLFLALAEADQVAVVDALPRWAKYLETQRRRPPVQDFIQHRRWELIPEAPAEGVAPPEAAGGKGAPEAAFVPHGFADQGWWALVWRAFRAGDLRKLGWRLQPDQLRHGWSAKASEAPGQAELDGLVRVARDAPEFIAWADHVDAAFRANRLGHFKLPRPTRAPFVWLPAPWPPDVNQASLSEIDEVLR